MIHVRRALVAVGHLLHTASNFVIELRLGSNCNITLLIFNFMPKDLRKPAPPADTPNSPNQLLADRL
jgi:hypothetical protein